MASREWVRFNESSRAKANRERHVAANGGEFVKESSGWVWRKGKVKLTPKPTPTPRASTRRTTRTRQERKGE